MRDILFRGKRTDNGEWVEEYYYKAKYCRTDDELCDYITVPHPKEYNEPSSHYIVDPETVGQYTGTTDKNGTKIFEGDICKVTVFTCEGEDKHFLCEVCFDYSSFIFRERSGLDVLFSDIYDFKTDVEVIGNIYDNTELMEGADNG